MRVLVTGGNGFLGGEICRQLRARGDAVRSVSRRAAPALAAMGVESLQGDLSVPADAARAVAGVDAVIHVAALAGVAGAWSLYQSANIDATANVLAACRAAGVARLVYTSTPSVAKGRGPLVRAVESTDYPAADFLTHYQRSKAQAEAMVLAANDAGLATCALRPHLIWGPGDTNLGPRLVARSRAGRLRFVGDGQQLVDGTYVENAAAAHLLALDRLRPGAPPAGRAYFIANDEPVTLATLMNGILRSSGAPVVTRGVPKALAWALGAVLERVWEWLRRPGEPPMTRFLALNLSSELTFDLRAARQDLGYAPAVSVAEGLRRLAAHHGVAAG